MSDFVTHVACTNCGRSLKSNKPMRVGQAKVRCPICGVKFLVESGDDEGPATRPMGLGGGGATSPMGVAFGPAASGATPAREGMAAAATPPSWTPHPPVRNAPKIAGYTILAELGRGGMGVVYKARHERLKRVVALKVIALGPGVPAEFLADFQAEAEAAARIHHPNILQIFEVGEHDGRPYLALEYAPGGTLKGKLEGGQPQPIRASAQFIELLARAVHAAHLRGVVHRDLKPANILLEHSVLIDDRQGGRGLYPEATQLYGVPKVGDFGLAVRMDLDLAMHHYGEVTGTPGYMAPEQAAGLMEEVGAHTDVYALGAILYEMLAARPPFRAKSLPDLLQKVAAEPPEPIRSIRPGVPRDLEAICLKCLEKDPRRRYRSALDLADDLARFSEGAPVLARPLGLPARAWRWALRNPIPASLLVTAVVTLAVGQWWLLSLSRQMVENTALQGAAHQTSMLREVNKLYTLVATEAKRGGSVVTRHFPSQDPDSVTLPIPARFTILLGERLEDQAEQDADAADSQDIIQVKMYSNFPFSERRDSPPKHKFGQDALAHFESAPEVERRKPFYIFDQYQGMRVLRYATPLIMEQRCLACHNNPDEYSLAKKKTDWKPGDVRGVLEVITPLDESERKTRSALATSYLTLGGLAATLLGGSWLGLTLGRNRRHA